MLLASNDSPAPLASVRLLKPITVGSAPMLNSAVKPCSSSSIASTGVEPPQQSHIGHARFCSSVKIVSSGDTPKLS